MDMEIKSFWLVLLPAPILLMGGKSLAAKGDTSHSASPSYTHERLVWQAQRGYGPVTILSYCLVFFKAQE